MKLDTLKKYAQDLHQMAGSHQVGEFTASLSWWEYRCKLVEFLMEGNEFLVKKNMPDLLQRLGYQPAIHWIKKFGISRQGFYRDVVELKACHSVKILGKKTYYTFQIGYVHSKKRTEYNK